MELIMHAWCMIPGERQTPRMLGSLPGSGAPATAPSWTAVTWDQQGTRRWLWTRRARRGRALEPTTDPRRAGLPRRVLEPVGPRRRRRLVRIRSSPWIYAPLALFVLPTLRRAEPRGLAIAVGVWTFLLIHWLLATVGLVNGWARTGHHYLDLVEALAIVGSVWGLSALA